MADLFLSGVSMASQRLVHNLSPFVFFLMAAASGQARTTNPPQPYEEDQLMLKFSSECSPACADSILTDLQATVIYYSEAFEDYVLRIEAYSVDDAIAKYRASPSIDFIEACPIYYSSFSSPSDPLFGEQWFHRNYGQAVGSSPPGTPGADVGTTRAWCINTGTDRVVVAILDSGTRATHPDLAGNIYVNPGEIPSNDMDDDGNGFVDDVNGWDFFDEDNTPDDVWGHGTHISGIIGAITNNTTGVAGMASDVSLMPVRITASGGILCADVLQGLEYAVMMDVDIVNCSFIGEGSVAVYDRIAAARDSGIVVVCSAGNWGYDNDLFHFYPASFDLPNIIAVTATPNSDIFNDPNNWWDGAHWGRETVDVAAPGVDIFSTLVCASDPERLYGVSSGTSMSSPVVCGTLALMKSQAPGIGVDSLKAVLLSTVDHLESLEGLILSEGRVNAHRALAALAPADSIVPQAIVDLTVLGAGASSVTVTWTAPGDDGSLGQACCYDLRYAIGTIDSGNFDHATMVALPPNPVSAGQRQEFTLTGLAASTQYSIALKTSDEQADNWSELSNVVAFTTSSPLGWGEDSVEDLGTKLPAAFSLSAPYPNPAVNQVSLSLSIPLERTGPYVFQVINVQGEVVLESRREIPTPGKYLIQWSGSDRQGRLVMSGVYLLRLEGPHHVIEMRKVTMIR